MKQRSHRATLRLLVLPAVLALGTGCDGLLGTSDRRPNEARIVVTGTSTEPLRLITSTRFSALPNIETGLYDVNFESFESADLPLPIERVVRLDTDRFVARLLQPDADSEASVLMEVYFDGQLAYRQEATLVDSFLDFIHVFN